MHRIMRIVLTAAVTCCFVAPANTSEAGLFDWMWRPRPVQYAPTMVGHFPTGSYYGAGPAATHYTTNYAPYSQGLYSQNLYSQRPYSQAQYSRGLGAYPTTAAATSYYAPYSNYGAPVVSQPATTFYRAPRTTYYRSPTTTFYRAPTTTNYPPTTAYYPPAPARRSFFGSWFSWQNACGGLTPCRPYASTTTNYNPRTSFRPVWQRVPVTYFRPVSQVDPVTGQVVQQMQQCTAYRWQVQQRTSLFPRRQPAAMASEPWCEPTGTPASAAPAGQRPATDPYYNRSRIIRPGDRLIPRDAEVIREETLEPSERRPRLQGDPPEPATMGSVRRREFDRVSSSPTASTRGTPLAPRSLDSNSDKNEGMNRDSLIPDPDQDRSGYPVAPKLMTPRDRTARDSAPRLQRVVYRAVWPDAKKPSVNRSPVSATQPLGGQRVHRQPTRKLDDSGWRSIR